MAVELSSNWKKLQAKIKAESSTSSKPATKRPRAGEAGVRKKPRRERPAAVKTTTTTTKTTKMGVPQSSQVAVGAPTPSLALWAADHDIPAEDLAAAYGLGTPRTPGTPGKPGRAAEAVTAAEDGARENAGLTAGLVVGKYVALDCEMVGVVTARSAGGGDGQRIGDALARVSVVDFFGRQVYDAYVRPQAGQRVVDWRTHVSGVAPRHLRAARPFDEVQAVVRGLLDGTVAAAATPASPRILVGHDVRHDLQALGLAHPPRLVRDTAKFSGFKQYGHGPKPALRVLARALLGVEIQQGAHSSVVDARVTMQLFRQHKPAFDVEVANKYGEAGGGKKGRGRGKR